MKLEGKLLKKLNTVGIEVIEVERKIVDDDGGVETVIHSIAKFPCAREFKELLFTDRIELETYLDSEFEHYRFIKDYEAIWSAKYKVIECDLQQVSRVPMPNSYVMRRLYRSLGIEVDEENELARLEFKGSESDNIASIGLASTEFALLSSSSHMGLPYERSLRRLTIRIENIDIQTHDQAKNVLEKVGNALLFKLDITSNLGYKLSQDREIRRAFMRTKREVHSFDTSFPNFEYDNEPMSLYWYARSAADMPLLQFLALYQILEFYFPMFSQQDAHHQIKNIIKDPRFNPNKDSDITKLLSTISQNKNQIGFGSELEQLKSTVSNCATADDIIEYIQSNDEMLAYYKDKRSKKLAFKSINVENKTADILTDCSERIYEIRCRVVHTKANDKNYDLLLPSSPELKHLRYDINLLEVIAKKVLIATSRVLKV